MRVPEDLMGDVMTDLQGRRSIIMGIEGQGRFQASRPTPRWPNWTATAPPCVASPRAAAPTRSVPCLPTRTRRPSGPPGERAPGGGGRRLAEADPVHRETAGTGQQHRHVHREVGQGTSPACQGIVAVHDEGRHAHADDQRTVASLVHRPSATRSAQSVSANTISARLSVVPSPMGSAKGLHAVPEALQLGPPVLNEHGPAGKRRSNSRPRSRARVRRSGGGTWGVLAANIGFVRCPGEWPVHQFFTVRVVVKPWRTDSVQGPA